MQRVIDATGGGFCIYFWQAPERQDVNANSIDAIDAKIASIACWSAGRCIFIASSAFRRLLRLFTSLAEFLEWRGFTRRGLARVVGKLESPYVDFYEGSRASWRLGNAISAIIS
jgi:hypothetical protein